MNINELPLSEIAQGVSKGEYSAVEVLQEFLKVIDQREERLNAFITVATEQALEAAKKVKKEQGGKLLGVPLALKDNLSTKGIRTTAGSKIIEDYIPPYNATVVNKVLGEGAIIMGKTNMDEFAMGASTENSAYGPTRNPVDEERVPGGSSGGSATAVAAQMAPAALGSDTGGSIRQPAAFTGVVGLNPTYGTVSRYGVIALTSSLDQVGPLAKTVEDARYLYQIISGKDPLDATTVEARPAKEVGIKNLRVGIPKEYLAEGLDQAIKERIQKVGKYLEEQGAQVSEVSLPHTQYGLSVYYIITPSEASSNLARFDGIRYGVQEEAGSVEEMVSKSRGKGFGAEPKRRIILGTFALSSGYADQYYLQAAKMRTLISQDFAKVFEKVDVLLTPTTPSTAFKIGEVKDPLSMYLADVFTIPAKLAGLPGLSVPVGTIHNLPIGAQLIGSNFSEEMLFNVGEFLEKEKWN